MEKANITDKINAFDITGPVQIEIIFDENEEINQESKGHSKQIRTPLQIKNTENEFSPGNNLKNSETRLIGNVEGSKEDRYRNLDFRPQDQLSLSGTENKLQNDKFNTISKKDSDEIKRNHLKQCKQEQINQQYKRLDGKNLAVQNNVTSSCEVPIITKTNPINNYKVLYDSSNIDTNMNALKNADRPKSNDKLLPVPKRNSDDSCYKKRKLDRKSSETEKGINTKIFCKDNNTTPIVNINDKGIQPPENSLDQNNSREAVLEFYVKRLLRSVMVNLIKIDEAYSFYEYAKISMPGNYIEIDKRRQNYRNLKYKLFSLSYHIAENMILPQQNNLAFIRSFLNDITELSNSSYGYKCSHHRIEYFLKELITWTTHTINSRLKHDGTKPTLDNHILSVRNEGTNCHQQQGNSFNTGITTITNNTTVIQPIDNLTNPNNRVLFSYGPQDRQIRISVPSLNKSPISVNSNPCNQNMGHMNSNYPCAQILQPHSTISSVNSYQIDKLTPWSRHSTFNTNNTKTLADLLGQPQKKPSKHSDYTLNTVSLHSTRITPPQLYENLRPNIEFENQTSNTTNNENNNDQTSNRSLSADSGFVSPVHFSPPLDAMNYQLPANSHQVETTTNKRIPNPENICFICGVSTRKLCKRCYGRYYCSVVCQNIDWPTHSLVCKDNNRN